MSSFQLKSFQRRYVDEMTEKIHYSLNAKYSTKPYSLSFSAPTGSGKTVMVGETLADLIRKTKADNQFELSLLWISDLPEINRQTAKRIQVSLPGAFDIRFLSSDDYLPKSLDPFSLYFINTQKLGSDRILTRRSETRSYDFWDVLNKTNTAPNTRLLLIIDEAHRGVGLTRGSGLRKNELGGSKKILEKFIQGDDSINLKPIRFILGMSATPDRFIEAMREANREISEVRVRVEEVRESGLIKDRILLHTSDQSDGFAVLKAAANRWREVTTTWNKYCSEQDEQTIHPAFIVQVEDSTQGSKTYSKTDLSALLRVVTDEAIGIRNHEIAHCFDVGNTIEIGEKVIPYVAPNEIQRNTDYKLILFKTALSTGWDCPRAEVLMSFRSASDPTAITQLVGRMVRNPLARAIEDPENLNEAHLYLPHYNEEQMENLIKHYEGEAPRIVPGRKQQLLKMVTLSEPMSQTIKEIPSFQVPRRESNKLSLLFKLARFLDRHKVTQDRYKESREKILDLMWDQFEQKRQDPAFQEMVVQTQEGQMQTFSYRTLTGVVTPGEITTVSLSQQLLETSFRRGGEYLSSLGLHFELRKRANQEKSNGMEPLEEMELMAEIIAFMLLREPYQQTVKLAEELYEEIKGQYIVGMPDFESDKLNKELDGLLNTNQQPTQRLLDLPTEISIAVPPEALPYHKHLYTKDGKSAKVALDNFNSLEEQVLEAELDHADCWLRNRPNQRYSASLIIPYQTNQVDHSSLYPDFLFFRETTEKVSVDIVDPHAQYLGDSLYKAKGLVVYARRHGALFDRILLVSTNSAGEIICLDMKDTATGEEILRQIQDPAGFVDYFERNGIPYLIDDVPYGIKAE